jgi:hypothetical protein
MEYRDGKTDIWKDLHSVYVARVSTLLVSYRKLYGDLLFLLELSFMRHYVQVSKMEIIIMIVIQLLDILTSIGLKNTAQYL